MREGLLLGNAEGAVVFCVETGWIVSGEFALVHGTNAYGYSYVLALLGG